MPSGGRMHTGPTFGRQKTHRIEIFPVEEYARCNDSVTSKHFDVREKRVFSSPPRSDSRFTDEHALRVRAPFEINSTPYRTIRVPA